MFSPLFNVTCCLLFNHLYLKILFLKAYLSHDFLCRHSHVFRYCHLFIFHIIKTVDNSDDLTCKFLYRVIYAQNIYILFLSIRSNDPFYVSIIYRIEKDPCAPDGKYSSDDRSRHVRSGLEQVSSHDLSVSFTFL